MSSDDVIRQLVEYIQTLERENAALIAERDRFYHDTEYSGPLGYYIPLVERMEGEINGLREQLEQRAAQP